MENGRSVAVIMSTFNGERFIREQIDSLLQQRDVDLRIYIRDDGSTDRTIDIINEYKRTYPIVLMSEDNIGVGNSFMNALYSVPDEYDYYCFADQDDIWLPDKVSSGVERLAVVSGPALYVTSQILADSNGNRIGFRSVSDEFLDSMHIFSNNCLTGCTMIWNRKLQLMLKEKNRRPSKDLLKKRIHDVWVALVASISGVILNDQDAHILYRQHGNNVVGAKPEAMLSIWKKKWLHPEVRNGRSTFAREIVDKFGDFISEDEYKKLKLCAEYKSKIRYRISLMLDKEMYQLSGEKPILYRMKVLLGLF